MGLRGLGLAVFFALFLCLGVKAAVAEEGAARSGPVLTLPALDDAIGGAQSGTARKLSALIASDIAKTGQEEAWERLSFLLPALRLEDNRAAEQKAAQLWRALEKTRDARKDSPAFGHVLLVAALLTRPQGEEEGKARAAAIEDGFKSQEGLPGALGAAVFGLKIEYYNQMGKNAVDARQRASSYAQTDALLEALTDGIAPSARAWISRPVLKAPADPSPDLLELHAVLKLRGEIYLDRADGEADAKKRMIWIDRARGELERAGRIVALPTALRARYQAMAGNGADFAWRIIELGGDDKAKAARLLAMRQALSFDERAHLILEKPEPQALLALEIATERPKSKTSSLAIASRMIEAKGFQDSPAGAALAARFAIMTRDPELLARILARAFEHRGAWEEKDRKDAAAILAYAARTNVEKALLNAPAIAKIIAPSTE